MGNNFFVSIIMPCYNAISTVSNSIDSIINQTYTNWELLLVNDCSKDKTSELLHSFSKKNKRVKVFDLKNNEGVANARNHGIKKSKGDIIAFCDSDDIWLDNKLEKQLEKISEGYDVVCSDIFVHVVNKQINYIRSGPEHINHSMLLKTNYIPNSSAIYNVKKLGKFYQKPVGHEDYLMWLEISNVSKKIFRIKTPLVIYLVHNSQISRNKLMAAKWTWNIYRNELKLNHLLSIYYFFHYALRSTFKSFFTKKVNSPF